MQLQLFSLGAHTQGGHWYRPLTVFNNGGVRMSTSKRQDGIRLISASSLLGFLMYMRHWSHCKGMEWPWGMRGPMRMFYSVFLPQSRWDFPTLPMLLLQMKRKRWGPAVSANRNLRMTKENGVFSECLSVLLFVVFSGSLPSPVSPFHQSLSHHFSSS